MLFIVGTMLSICVCIGRKYIEQKYVDERRSQTSIKFMRPKFSNGGYLPLDREDDLKLELMFPNNEILQLEQCNCLQCNKNRQLIEKYDIADEIEDVVYSRDGKVVIKWKLHEEQS
jgi:hypothetical protein